MPPLWKLSRDAVAVAASVLRWRRLQLVLLSLGLLTLFAVVHFQRDGLAALRQHTLSSLSTKLQQPSPPPDAVFAAPAAPTASAAIGNGNVLKAHQIQPYVDAIFGRSANVTNFSCPEFNRSRYAPLQSPRRGTDPRARWFLALNLRNCVELLPRLMGSIVEAIKFLGPENCVLSIVEGQSPDGTADVLVALETELKAMGAQYYFRSSTVDPSADDRIGRLAKLRNMALNPLFIYPERMSRDATVVFLNDVAACPDDILELAYQRQVQGADMTCAMDWNHISDDESLFYDVWVSRDITGDIFFDITSNGGWDRAKNLFWDSNITRSRFEAKRPFQVFACWNGAAVFAARPLLEDKIRFRSSNGDAGECFMGEPTLLCKDFWFHGHGKIAVVPSVNLQYTVETGRRIKQQRGFAADIVAQQDPADDAISPWLGAPDMVKCMPGFDRQSWVSWNQSLV